MTQGQALDIQQKNTILITCGPGLADYLRPEIEALGHTVESTHPGGIEISGSLQDAMNLNLHLQTAYNVLYLLKQFNCTSPNDLYKEVSSIPWEQIIPPEEYLSVVSRVDTPSIDNTMFASLKVKDAVVDRMVKKTGSRPDSGKERNAIVIHLYWRDDRVWLYLNTSGTKLTDRGYRKLPFKAPMRESLAAGVIMATGYDGSVPLVNPMCGSGTLAIEAALLAAKRPVGLLRSNYGFMHFKDFDADNWKTMRTEAAKAGKKLAKNNPVAPIIASDISTEAIWAAKKNALTAGVDHLIQFHVCDFNDTPFPEDKGLVVINPEYGERMGELRKLETTYNQIGDFFKQKCAGYTCYLFTGNPQLGKKVGLKTSRKIPFFNGNIECRLLKYDMYEGTRRQPKKDDQNAE